MYAFVQRICEHSGIVRCGPVAREFGDDYDFAVAYEIKGDKAIIQALVEPLKFKGWLRWLNWLYRQRPYTRAHYSAIYNAIVDTLHKKPDWDRSKKGKLRASKATAPRRQSP